MKSMSIETKVWILLAVIVWLCFITNDTFSKPQNIENLFLQCVPLLLIGLGQAFVVLLGDIDLSVGSMVALLSVVLAGP